MATNTFDGWTLDQLRERRRLNTLRGITSSPELRDEIARREYSELPEPQPQPCPVNAAHVAAIRLAAGVDARIKRAHDARGCTTWETWTSTERDQTGRKFTAHWTGCRACHVQILEN